MFSSWTLLVFSFLPLSVAYHIVDDANGDIRYSVRVWNPESENDPNIRRDKCFNNTYTAAGHVSTSDGAFFEIPFIGTSISLFIVTLPTCMVNTSITVDDEAPTIHSFQPTKTTYNVRLYSSTPLPFGNHSIHVDLLDSLNGTDNTSCLFLDYAIINDTLDGASCSTTLAASSPTITIINDQLSNRGLTDADLGGIIGGLLAFIVVVFSIFFLWVRPALKKTKEKDGTESQSLHGCSIGSPSSTLVQISYPVSPPPSLPPTPPAPTQLSQQPQRPEMDVRIDARSSGPTVIYNYIPGH